MKDESERYSQLKRRLDEDHEKWDKQTKDRKLRYQQEKEALAQEYEAKLRREQERKVGLVV